MSEQMEVIRLNVRISDLEASVLFWKKDAIAGTTRIRELQAALREALDYIELDSEYPDWMGRLRALAGSPSRPDNLSIGRSLSDAGKP